MWKSIKQEICVQRTLFQGGILIVALAWSIGILIMMIAMHFMPDEESYFCLGTVMAMMFGGLIISVMAVFVIVQGFDDAVHMGKTRKKYIPSIFLVNVSAIFLTLLLARLLLPAESALYGQIYPELAKEELPEAFMTLPWLICYAVAAGGVTGAAGGAMKANRKVGGGICMVLWLLICWGIPGIDEENSAGLWFLKAPITMAANWFLGLPEIGRMGCFLVIGAVGYGIMYFLLRKRATD